MTTLVNTEMAADTAVIKTIYARRAVRKYKKKAVSFELLETILDAGRAAPSAMNLQPWKFHVLTSMETIRSFSKEIAKIGMREAIRLGPKQILKTVSGILQTSSLAEIVKGKDTVFYGAPAVIFISAAKENEWAALDIGMCCQNMMLAAKSLGLDSCPVGFAKFAERTKIYPLLKVPDNEQVHLAVIIGYGDEAPEPHKRRKDNIFYVDEQAT